MGVVPLAAAIELKRSNELAEAPRKQDKRKGGQSDRCVCGVSRLLCATSHGRVIGISVSQLEEGTLSPAAIEAATSTRTPAALAVRAVGFLTTSAAVRGRCSV